MFVSGPTAAIVTGRSARSSVARSSSMAPSGRARDRGLRQVRAAEAVLAVDVARDVERPHQRAGGARRDRDVGPAGQRQHAQRVVRGGRSGAVARDGRHRQQLQLRPGDAEDHRERVVVPGIAIEDERDRFRHRASMPKSRPVRYDARIGADPGPSRSAAIPLAATGATRPGLEGSGGGHMHKRLGLTLFAGLAIFVSACSSGGSSASPSAAARRPRHRRPHRRAASRLGLGRGEPVGVGRRRHLRQKLKVGLVTDVGRINDKGFNQSAYEGMQAAQAAAPTCFDTKYIETQSQSDYAKNIAEFTDAG